MKKVGKVIIGLLITSLCINACKPVKDATGTSGVVTVTSPDVFSSRLKLTLPQEKKDYSINGNLKMVNNELIQISLVAPVLRTEAVRIEVTPKEMLVIDRINKQYAVAPVEELRVLLGNRMDYERLQTILTQAVFIEGRDNWVMREDGVEISLPIHHEEVTERLLIELNRITIPKQKPVPTNPSSKYEKKELSEVIEAIERL